MKALVFVLVLLAVSVSAEDRMVNQKVWYDFPLTISGGRSAFTDTIGITSGLNLDGLLGWFVLNPSPVTLRGLGLTDSAYIRLYSVMEAEWHLIVQDSCNSLPCSLRVAYPSSTAGLDTLFKEDLRMIYTVSDTTSDSAFTAEYPLKYVFKLINEN